MWLMAQWRERALSNPRLVLHLDGTSLKRNAISHCIAAVVCDYVSQPWVPGQTRQICLTAFTYIARNNLQMDSIEVRLRQITPRYVQRSRIVDEGADCTWRDGDVMLEFFAKFRTGCWNSLFHRTSFPASETTFRIGAVILRKGHWWWHIVVEWFASKNNLFSFQGCGGSRPWFRRCHYVTCHAFCC